MFKDKTHEQKKALNREFKSKMLHKIVETISHKEIRDMIGFRGGAVLHLAYSSPRYTNDLDFIWLQSDSFENKSKIISMLSEEKLSIESIPMNLNIKKIDEKTLRLSYNLETHDESFKPTFVIESTDMGNCSYDFVQYNTSKGHILVETPEDILIDKLIATIERFTRRQSIKDTDIFDMFYLMNKKRFITSENLYKHADFSLYSKREMLDLFGDSSNYIKLNKNKIWNSITEQLDSTYLLKVDEDMIFATALNLIKHTRDILVKESQMKLF